MKTIAEFKRQFQVGTQIRQIWNVREGTVDYLLTVTKVQTQSIRLAKEGGPQNCWIGFPKQEEIAFTENGWCRLEGDQKMAEYVWVQPT